MTRNDFLKSLGLSTAAIAFISWFGGCKTDSGVTDAPTNVDFTLNLDDPANNGLKTNGGYIYKNGIIVARTTSGTYVALSMVCTHAGSTVYYDAGGNRLHCPNHGSNFATDGTVINGPASNPLATYHTTLAGSSLRVYS